MVKITNETFFFSSILKSKYRSELENLMFFNPQQERFQSAIIESIEKFGKPEIKQLGDYLRIHVLMSPDVQTLFAFEKEGNEVPPIGLIVYCRTDVENITVLHIAVNEEYSLLGSHADKMLVMKMIVVLRKIASQIKGINYLTIMYEHGNIRKIPV